jgi:hypothetical protein
MPAFAAHMRGAFADASFAPYGLDDRWQGTRWLGGTGSSDNEITRLELAHGENPWDEESSQVRVQALLLRAVSLDDATNIAINFDSLTRQQVNGFWMATGTLPDDVRRAAFASGRDPGDATAPWDDSDIPVDGETVTFRRLGGERYWVAQARHAEVMIGIEAQAWSPALTGLVTIDDLAPYLAGARLIAERGRRGFA